VANWGAVGLDGSRNVTPNAGPGVGGKREAAGRIELEDGLPQADAPGLERLGVGEWSRAIPADDGMDEAIVLRHQVVEGLTVSVLCLVKERGLGGPTGVTRLAVMN
jgi:hypothetical protein